MKRTFTSLVVGVALFVGSGGVGLAQDFDAGVAALNRGDYATAFNEFSALVERGNFSAQYKRSKREVIEKTLYQAGNPQFQFDVSGLSWDHS